MFLVGKGCHGRLPNYLKWRPPHCIFAQVYVKLYWHSMEFDSKSES